MDQFFSFLSRNKSVIKFKIQSKTGNTDAFSSPEVQIKSACLSAKLKCRIKTIGRHTAGAAEGQNMQEVKVHSMMNDDRISACVLLSV